MTKGKASFGNPIMKYAIAIPGMKERTEMDVPVRSAKNAASTL